MKTLIFVLLTTIICISFSNLVYTQVAPEDINFVRQGVQRMIFDEDQSIPLSSLDPDKIVGITAMYPVTHYSQEKADVTILKDKLVIESKVETQTDIWFGGFNPFATYTIDLDICEGEGKVGFQFSDSENKNQFFILLDYVNDKLSDVTLSVVSNGLKVAEESIAVNAEENVTMKGKVILQMLGSGLTVYMKDEGLPKVIGQSDFNKHLDLRKKKYIHSFQSHLFVKLKKGRVQIDKVTSALTTGVGQADIRVITYENGDPLMDQGRLWYTMSIRGRALPHHIQGVFSMNPTVFDVKLEGIIVFDRDDGLLRNEISSHLFYDRKQSVWRGITTGFSAYANIESEKKQLLAIESKQDPRFGFSVMKAVPFGIVGDIEDTHILFDSTANKWRMLTCVNEDGYKAVILESDHWNKDYKRISGPVKHNSTGTSIQKIGDKLYCFSGSSEREIFIYTYPDLHEVGILKMDLPPWDSTSRTRVWPNIVELPEGYSSRYVALMMDRYNYPGLNGPNWSYGAMYLYHGYD